MSKYTNSKHVKELIGKKDIKIVDGKLKVVNKNFIAKNGLIKFYAPWCPHCTALVDDLNFLGEGLKNESFMVGAINVDVEVNKEISKKAGISGLPTLFLMDLNGNLEEYSNNSREMPDMLDEICNFTNKICYKKDNKKLKKK